jgi:hypothetical protein
VNSYPGFWVVLFIIVVIAVLAVVQSYTELGGL